MTYEIGATSANILCRIGSDFWDRPYYLTSDKKAAEEAKAKGEPYMLESTTRDKSFVFASLGIKDVNKSYDDFFTSLNQPTVELSVSLAWNSVYDVNWEKLNTRSNPIKQWDLYIKAFVNNTFSDYYDTQKNSITSQKKWPLVNYGAQLDYIAYRKRVWFPITLTLARGMLIDNIKPYSKLPTVVDSNGDPSLYEVGKPVGKYGGVLDKQQWNSRASFTIFTFLGNEAGSGCAENTLSKLCLLPNYSMYGTIDKRWYHVVGGSIGLLKDKYNTSKKTALDIKPLLQFGVDWQSNPMTHVWSKPYWIFSFKGTIK